jgi:hypothetical protein
MARPAGLEPATLGLEGRCSIRLSYGRLKRGRYCTLSSWLCALNRPSIRLFSRFIAFSTSAALLAMLSIGSPVAIQTGIHACHYQGRIAGKLTQAAPQPPRIGAIDFRTGIKRANRSAFAVYCFPFFHVHTEQPEDRPVS